MSSGDLVFILRFLLGIRVRSGLVGLALMRLIEHRDIVLVCSVYSWNVLHQAVLYHCIWQRYIVYCCMGMPCIWLPFGIIPLFWFVFGVALGPMALHLVVQLWGGRCPVLLVVLCFMQKPSSLSIVGFGCSLLPCVWPHCVVWLVRLGLVK